MPDPKRLGRHALLGIKYSPAGITIRAARNVRRMLKKRKNLFRSNLQIYQVSPGTKEYKSRGI
jgi:hypothetical protein